jgi:ABC-type Zn uptake system ZnuABC Zn-binding protein ZnuA
MSSRPRLRARTIVLVAALCAPALGGCGSGAGDGDGADGRPVVVATTTQVGDLTRAVAGDRAAVRQILHPSSDPHDYEPRPSDVKAVTGAAVVVRSGGDLDAWLDGVLENAGSKAKAVVLIDGIDPRRDGDQIDPHWWQNPRNAIVAVGEIRAALTAADPAGRAVYARNANGYLARLRALDRAVASCMAKVPAPQRRLVTDHDALGYYADRYGIEVIGTVIPSLSTQAQASAASVTRLVRTIRSAGVRTIFSERSVNPKLTRAIARDAGATVGAPLYADSLGAAGSAGATYVGSIEANTRALVAGFTAGRLSCRL